MSKNPLVERTIDCLWKVKGIHGKMSLILFTRNREKDTLEEDGMICLHSTSVFGLFWTFIYPPLTFSLPPLSSQSARKLTKFCEQCQLESMNTIVSTNGFKRLSFFFKGVRIFFFKARRKLGDKRVRSGQADPEKDGILPADRRH